MVASDIYISSPCLFIIIFLVKLRRTFTMSFWWIGKLETPSGSWTNYFTLHPIFMGGGGSLKLYSSSSFSFGELASYRHLVDLELTTLPSILFFLGGGFHKLYFSIKIDPYDHRWFLNLVVTVQSYDTLLLLYVWRVNSCIL